MTDMNYIELHHKTDGCFSLCVHYLADAKKFAAIQWKTGLFSKIEVVNKKDKIVWSAEQ